MDYLLDAQALLDGFDERNIEKAVYSRVKKVEFEMSKALELFHELCATYPKAFVYLVSSELFGTWIGASPELLLNQQDTILKTVALAGTRVTGEPREWTTKEQHEHRYVTEHIVATLKQNKCQDIETNGPFASESGPVEHLKTAIQAVATAENVWDLALDLHPTPAVCGTPRNSSLELIQHCEKHQRDLYAGIIGLKTVGETNLFVNLRCAQLFENEAFLYVGGGFTQDSVPALEWDETENKAKTLEKLMKKLEN